MTYFITLIFSFFFLYIFYGNYTLTNNKREMSKSALSFVLFIPAFYWLLVLGLQYYVGTDYPTYYKYFDTGTDLGLYLRKREYAFYFVAQFVYKSFLPAQAGFFLISFIQILFLCKFCLYLKFDRPDIFIVIYFCCATCFYNQMNAIRQYTAMAIFLYASVFIYERKLKKYIIYILFASMFHFSAIILLMLYPFSFLFNLKSSKWYKLFLILSLFLMYKGMDNFITFFVSKSSYAAYLDSFYFLEQNRKSFKNIITKLVFLPFYFRVMAWLPKYMEIYSKKDVFFIKMGTVFYGIKLIAFSSFFLSRFAMYFDLLAYVPLYYYLRELISHYAIKKWARILELVLFLSISVGLWIAKVLIAPTGEYLYNSVLFN